MNVSSELRWLNAILFLVITLLITAVLYAHGNFVNINHNFNELTKANKCIDQIDTLETTIYKTESSVRLYMITQKLSLIKNQYDQTENIRAIKELLNGDPRLLRVIDTLNAELAGRFLLWNRLINLPADATPGQEKDLIMTGDTITQHIMALTGRLKTTEREIILRNDENTRSGVRSMTILVGGSILFSISLFLFAFIKLTRQIKREALVHTQLQIKNIELDRSNKELEQFAYIASHDLQEPLRKIHTYTDRLATYEKANLSHEGKEIIDKLQVFARRMQRLIDDLLGFSRLLQHTLTRKPVDLNKILSDTILTMSSQIQASGAIIKAEPLPALMGYESQLLQLFQNLISNSIKYQRAGIAPHISIKASIVLGKEIKGIKPADAGKKFYKISFADNGIGFNNENAERIFVIFQRLHGRSEYEGTGIGLAICKLVVENHDGYIYASSKEGEGADFTICFPLA
jgi:signal transduction histidine kinase